MKAISLTQPWATLVAIGAKKIETRSWRTNYRGRIAIHAAKSYPRWARETCEEGPFAKALGKLDPAGLLRGYVLATADLLACLPTNHIEIWLPILPPRHAANILRGDELQFGDYGPDRYAWVLADVKPPPLPIEAKGALGLWEWKEPA